MATDAYFDPDEQEEATDAYLDPDEQEADGDKCDLFRCFCCWRKYCRPHVPRYAPGRDVYTRAPSESAAAGDHPNWSVLVGCISAMVPFHNLRLHRFRVAASGRVIGHTDDALEPVVAVSPGDGSTFIAKATVALAPSGHRLYGCYMEQLGFDGALIRSAADLPPDDARPQLPQRAFAVDLDTDSLLSPPPPPLPFRYGSYYTVSAHGKLWAPSAVDVEEDTGELLVRLVMHRLELDDNTWAEAASVDMPSVNFRHLSAYYLEGCAVIRDRFILLSLSNSTFFCFDCATGGTLTPVKTAGGKKSSSSKYTPIYGKAVHVRGDGDGDGDDDDMVVYFLRLAKLFAYRLSVDDEGKLLIVAPPVEVERLWPYYEEGYGSVVQLSGRMLCAVWMNMNLPCGCAQRHALITTLLVRGGHGGDDGGVEVLHSTCRRVDMLRSKAVPRWKSYDALCFLQEYPDRAGTGSQQVDVDPSRMWMPIGSSTTIAGSSLQQEVEEITDDMLNCCREFLRGGVPILKECTSVVTNPDFYFICQAYGGFSHVYKISVARGKLTTCHQQLLQPHLSLDTITPGECAVDDGTSWHFVQQQAVTNKLYVIPSAPAENHYEVDVDSKLSNVIELERPYDGVCFSLVSRAGKHIVALGDTLQDVYLLDEPALKWIPLLVTSSVPGSVDLTRKVNISGFVDLIHEDILVVSDADVAGCFLLDLRNKEWFVVKPPPGMWQRVEGVLCGRCLFAEGFVYTCIGEELVAFELLKEDICYCLGWPVLMEFPYMEFPDRKLVSFDLICKEVDPSSLVFCVVEGCCMPAPWSSRHRLIATTVEVKLQESAKGRKVPVRIDHIDISNSTVDHEGWIWTSHAFSL